MADNQPTEESHRDYHPTTAAVSRGIVGIYAKLYGRGPANAQSYLHDDFVLTILEESFTPAETTLIRAGNPQQVHETRRAFQEAVRDELVAVVESATKREVATFISQVDIMTETAIELFLLRPEDGTATE